MSRQITISEAAERARLGYSVTYSAEMERFVVRDPRGNRLAETACPVEATRAYVTAASEGYAPMVNVERQTKQEAEE